MDKYFGKLDMGYFCSSWIRTWLVKRKMILNKRPEINLVSMFFVMEPKSQNHKIFAQNDL